MGKGSGSSSTPVEDPDTLRSSQQLSIIDVWSEGQIYGLKDGAKSIFLNETPVEDVQGVNLNGVDCQWNVGTQGQAPLAGFPSVSKEVAVSLEVKQANPIIRTVTDPDINRVRVTVGVQALYSVDEDDGDIHGTTVQMYIKIDNKIVKDVTIDGKTRSQYLRQYVIDNLPAPPFNITVERVTPDSGSVRLENKTLWSSYTEIIDAKLSYPNTALIGIKFDSEQFQGVPRRNYHLLGLLVKIPSNYNPETRDYTGFWDGTFKIGWTNNPAWVFYDIVTSNRYGLGERIGGESGVDKTVMYQIAQYCDALVDDGFGGREPRMTCNVYITDAKQANEFLNDLCSIFRGMPIWNGLQLAATIDMPSDTVWVYSGANVVDGKFTYSASALKARHTAAEVEYINPKQAWEKQTEYVSDDAMIARYGYNVKKLTAFGCTSRGQAHRMGKWILVTEKLEKQTVTFSVGREGLQHLPGDVIEIADNAFSGKNMGGRIDSASADFYTITLDRDVVMESGGATLTVINENGKTEKTNVISVASDKRTIIVNDAIQTVKTGLIWSFTSGVVDPRKFRCMAIAENDDGSLTVTAVEHHPEKENIVDEGLVFEPDPDTNFGGDIPAVEHLDIDAVSQDETWQIRATWDTPRLYKDLQFQCELSNLTSGTSKLVTRKTVNEMVFTHSSLALGQYILTVRGVNNIGQLGTKTTVSFDIALPIKPVELITTADNFQNMIRPVLQAGTALGTNCEYYWGRTEAEALAADKTRFLGRGVVMIHMGLSPDTDYWYAVQTVNPVGKSAFVTKLQRTALNPDGLLEVIGNQLSSPGFYRIQTADGIFPPDTVVVNAMFKAAFGKDPFTDDVLTIYSVKPDGTLDVSDSRMFDGNRWVVPALFLDGDLIAEGTIKGNRLVASVSIEAPIVRGGQVIAAELTSSGNPPKFQITTEGKAYLRDADIAGKITATSGEMTNVIIRENCTVLGKITANQIVGDITSGQGKDVPELDLGSGYIGQWTTVQTFNCKVSSSGKPRVMSLTSFIISVRGGSESYGGYIEWRTVINGDVVATGTIQSPKGTGFSGCISGGKNIGAQAGAMEIQVRDGVGNSFKKIPAQVAVCSLIVQGGEFI